MTLVTCPACQRHVRRTERCCPFCSTQVPAEVTSAPEPRLPIARLGRAALAMFAAASVGAGCGGRELDTTLPDAGNATTGGSGNGGVAGATGITGNGAAGMLGSGGGRVFIGPLPSGGSVGSGGAWGSGGYNVAPPYGAPGFAGSGGANGGAGGADTGGSSGAAGAGGSAGAAGAGGSAGAAGASGAAGSRPEDAGAIDAGRDGG